MKTFLYKLTHWETWHYLAKYIPIMPIWGWYCLKARSLWFFTSSNPTISFGGFEGETKREMYTQLPQGCFPETIYISPEMTIGEVEQMIRVAGLGYPFAVKPNAGMMGLMFRRIGCRDELEKYHRKMPVEYIIQTLIDYPVEVSVFYYRHPNDNNGTITGFVKKEFLQVTGDGVSTLRALILSYDRVRFRLDEMMAKHEANLELILAEGQLYVLCYALNLSRGGRLVSLSHEKDARLLQVFDKLSHHARHFYYGRYDVKCASIEDLRQGRNFSILEYNGCGAEPHHAYGNGHTIWQAYGIFLHHWKMLYRISEYNHRNGFPRWGFRQGWQSLKKGKANFRLLKRIDAETAI